MVEGKYLMAWLSDTLQAAGVVEEDPVAGLLVEVATIARGDKAPDPAYLCWLVEGATRHYAEVVREPAPEPGPDLVNGTLLSMEDD
jgi:hypothetical protein